MDTNAKSKKTTETRYCAFVGILPSEWGFAEG